MSDPVDAIERSWVEIRDFAGGPEVANHSPAGVEGRYVPDAYAERLEAELVGCREGLHQLEVAVALLRELSEKWSDVRVSGNAARVTALGDAVRRAREFTDVAGDRP